MHRVFHGVYMGTRDGRVTRCDVNDELTPGRVDVSYEIDGEPGEATVYVATGSRDDVEVRPVLGPLVSEWDSWLVEAATNAFERRARSPGV